MKRLKRPAGASRLKPGPGTLRLVKRLMVTVAVLAVLACGLVIWLGFFTDVCAVDRIEITGNRILTVDYVRRLSGVDSYENLLRMPVRRLQKNLEHDPWILEANIGRRLLSTVTIRVVERAPIALLDTGGAGFLVDGTGYVISGIATDQFQELPRIFGAEIPPPRIEDKVDDEKVAGCIEVLASMPQGLRDTLAMGNPFDGRGQVFISRGGFNVIYGDAVDLKKKNEVLEAIMTDIGNNKRSVAYVDVRVPDSPVMMLR